MCLRRPSLQKINVGDFFSFLNPPFLLYLCALFAAHSSVFECRISLVFVHVRVPMLWYVFARARLFLLQDLTDDVASEAKSVLINVGIFLLFGNRPFLLYLCALLAARLSVSSANVGPG